jgi:hypothetical protein
VIEFSFSIMVDPPTLTVVNDCIGNGMFSVVDEMNVPLFRAVHTSGRLRQKVALVLQKVLDAPEPIVEGLRSPKPVDNVSPHFR